MLQETLDHNTQLLKERIPDYEQEHKDTQTIGVQIFFNYL
jgi:hypothetical protein